MDSLLSIRPQACSAGRERYEMTFRIERDADGRIRLVGQIQEEHLHALEEQLADSGPDTILDLDEVTLVDVTVVRFLLACEAKGAEILNAPPYIREWMFREGDR